MAGAFDVRLVTHIVCPLLRRRKGAYGEGKRENPSLSKTITKRPLTTAYIAAGEVTILMSSGQYIC